ncbi:Uu.00g070890.m01.CDS01 [Anthostomella pinea]|uniref:Uu.00g070890.m01.CDS01 n=1 Tax=Anthostomella pinea TaxID=933095 RepID=A0AAI8YNK8_9PEZI|nr:Uu.00g070890.m01.CDS01 [Anthostomella pinea]
MTTNTGIAWPGSSNGKLYAGVALGSLLVWLLSTLVYNVYFHPLRKYPGPLLQRASGLPWALRHSAGVQAFHTQKLHDAYGPVVRIGPNHLSFTDPKAWKDIYGHRVGSESQSTEMPKAKVFLNTLRAFPSSIISAEREEHSRLRRALSHGFSDSSMRQQEPTIVKYVDLLLDRLHRECGNGAHELNMEAWYNWTTFDVVGDLVFGQSFGCLEHTSYHPWIRFIIGMVRTGAVMISLGYVGLGEVVQLMFRFGNLAVEKMRRYIDDMLRSRLEMGKPRDDLFEGLVKRREDWNLSFDKLTANAFVLVLAGSETTATTCEYHFISRDTSQNCRKFTAYPQRALANPDDAVSGATYLLLSHPDIHEKLKQEVRSTFSNAGEITMNTVNSLSYMLSTLSESLRLYPPVTSNLVRVVPSGGALIADSFVPGGTYVEVQHWSTNHSKDNWADPWAFRPERFLASTEEARLAGDKLDALQAFSIGPRNCIGRNLAYAEMRLILARIVYDFDLTLADDSKDWIERQKTYALWDRIPLNVYLTPAQGGSKA